MSRNHKEWNKKQHESEILWLRGLWMCDAALWPQFFFHFHRKKSIIMTRRTTHVRKQTYQNLCRVYARSCVSVCLWKWLIYSRTHKKPFHFIHNIFHIKLFVIYGELRQYFLLVEMDLWTFAIESVKINNKLWLCRWLHGFILLKSTIFNVNIGIF